MRIALETSTRSGSVAAARGDEVRESALSDGAAHARDLLPRLEELLATWGAAPDEIQAIAVDVGPGSYTGLRIGIATAQGLARATGAATIGVASGEVAAFAALAPGQTAVHLLDARSGELYLAHYRRTDDDVEVLLAPTVVPVDEIERHLPPADVVLSDARGLLEERVAVDVLERLRDGVVPRARDLLTLGLRRLERDGPIDPRALAPLYLRPFAARIRAR